MAASNESWMGGWKWVKVVKMGEGGQKVQTSSYKVSLGI